MGFRFIYIYIYSIIIGLMTIMFPFVMFEKKNEYYHLYIYTPGVGVDFLCVGVGCVFFSKLDPFKSNLES